MTAALSLDAAVEHLMQALAEMSTCCDDPPHVARVLLLNELDGIAAFHVEVCIGSPLGNVMVPISVSKGDEQVDTIAERLLFVGSRGDATLH